jgi:hypothetical protein
LICGRVKPGEVELLRSDDGNWIKVVAPSIAETDLFSSADFECGVNLGSSDPMTMTFLLTPLADNLAAALSVYLRTFLRD